jgi:hypothetical protein
MLIAGDPMTKKNFSYNLALALGSALASFTLSCPPNFLVDSAQNRGPRPKASKKHRNKARACGR